MLRLTVADLSRRHGAVTVVARAICRDNGPKPDCYCDGDESRCHAVTLYRDFSVAAVAALTKAEYLK